MRQHALREYVEGHDPWQTTAILAHIHRRGDHGGPPYDIALLALAALLNSGTLAYERTSTLYMVAKDQGHTALLELFLSAGVMERPSAGARDADRQLTLGHRKVQARSGGRDDLQRLLRDPELEVLPHLLQNPRLTERDVVALAAQRPADPELLRQLAQNTRWIKRYGLRRALVLNPFTPSDVSVRLLPFLLRPDLILVSTTPGLPRVVREAAQRIAHT